MLLYQRIVTAGWYVTLKENTISLCHMYPSYIGDVGHEMKPCLIPKSVLFLVMTSEVQHGNGFSLAVGYSAGSDSQALALAGKTPARAGGRRCSCHAPCASFGGRSGAGVLGFVG